MNYILVVVSLIYFCCHINANVRLFSFQSNKSIVEKTISYSSEVKEFYTDTVFLCFHDNLEDMSLFQKKIFERVKLKSKFHVDSISVNERSLIDFLSVDSIICESLLQEESLLYQLMSKHVFFFCTQDGREMLYVGGVLLRSLHEKKVFVSNITYTKFDERFPAFMSIVYDIECEKIIQKNYY